MRIRKASRFWWWGHERHLQFGSLYDSVSAVSRGRKHSTFQVEDYLKTTWNLDKRWRINKSLIARWIPLQLRLSLEDHNFFCLVLKRRWELRKMVSWCHRILSAPAASCSISGWTTMQECRRMEDEPTETWEVGCSCSLLFPITPQTYHTSNLFS